MKKSLAIGIFCAMGAVILGLGAYIYTLDGRIDNYGYVSNAYGGAAASEFTGAMSRLDESLTKLQWAGTAPMQSALCSEAAASAAAASTALSSLPCSTQELETLSGYINRTGDYALWLSKECAAGRTLTSEETEALAGLGDTMSEVSTGCGGVFTALDDGKIELDDYGSCISDAEGTLGAELAKIDASLDEFPELDYGGKYATRTVDDEQDDSEGVSEDDAALVAAEVLGVDESKLEREGLSGEPGVYSFSVDGRRASVSKSDGTLLYLDGESSGGERMISSEEARVLALEFAGKYAGDGLSLLKTEESPNAYGFTFAAATDGVVSEQNTVRVTIDAASGAVCGYSVSADTQSVDMEPAVSAEEAAKSLSSVLEPSTAELCLASVDGGNETLCWRFDCTDGEGTRVFVYIDAKMGTEYKIEAAQA